MSGQVLVFIEHDGKEISNITGQLVTRGREQAGKLGVPLDALILGHQVQDIVQTVAKMDFDSVFVADSRTLGVYNPEVYAGALARLFQEMAPRIVLFGDTYIAREIAPAIAMKLGILFLSSCVDLDLSENKVVIAQPKYNGVIYVKAQVEPMPASVLVSLQSRPDTPETACTHTHTPKIIPLDVEVNTQDLRTKVVEIVQGAATGFDITKANIVVSGGRGLGIKENLSLIRELAQVLGGVIACSRPLCDLGWLPMDHLVGMSGKTINPGVYLACGISGATQHLMGMSGSRCIIAINKDVNAPIFRIAHYAVVGDVREILPALIKEAHKAKVESKTGG